MRLKMISAKRGPVYSGGQNGLIGSDMQYVVLRSDMENINKSFITVNNRFVIPLVSF